MKALPFVLVGLGLISGAYPKFKTQPFDMVNVRFCPATANTQESLEQLRFKGKKFKSKDFLNQEDAQASLYQEYCRSGQRMLAEIWDEKAPELELSVDSSSLDVKRFNNLSKHTDIIMYLISIGCISTAYIWQSGLYKHESKLCFERIKRIENDVIGTAYNANRTRQYNQKLAQQTWNTRELEQGLIDSEGLQKQIAKQEVLEDAKYKTVYKSYEREQSEHEKVIAENLRDASKADKERNKITGVSLGNGKEKTDSSKQRQELINSLTEALKQYENGWLCYLVQSFTPIILWGKAGSYKSYTAACLALLKHYLIDAKLESIADIDYHQNKDKSWEYLTRLEPNVYGNGIDWTDYGRAYNDAIERSKTRTQKDKPIVSIWDELTNANGQFENASKIIPFVIATPRKRNEHCILLSHNLTQACLGGCENIAEPIKTQTYRLQLKSNPMGEPLFKGNLNGLVNDDGDFLDELPITLPKWLRPEIIYNHFNGHPIEF